MIQLSIASKVGTLLVLGNSDNPVPTLIQNTDPNNTVYLGDSTEVTPLNPLKNVPLSPGQSTVVDGSIDVYGIAAANQVVQVSVMPGVTSFFQPTNLSLLGGVGIYNTVTAPTQPPTIPLNSLWFSPNGAINQWNGSAWVPISFSGAQIITANTITVNQLAAGIVYAGIINGTVVNAATFNGSIFNGTNWTSDANGARYYSGTPAVNNLIASIGNTQYTDAFGNVVLPGVCAYNPPSGGFALFCQMYQGGINIGVSTGADETTGWTAQVSGLGSTAAGVLQYANTVDGNVYRAGISTVRMASNQPFTTTSPVNITNQQFNVVNGQVYRIWFMAIISSDTANAGGMTFSIGGNSSFGNVNGRWIAWQTGANTPSMGVIDGSLITFNSFSPSVANTKQVIELEMWPTVNGTGTMRLNAQLTAAAATFHVKSCIGRMEALL